MKTALTLLLNVLCLSFVAGQPDRAPVIDYAQRPQNQICTRLIIDEFKCIGCTVLEENLLGEIRTDVEEILDKYQHCDILSRTELPRIIQMLDNENSLNDLSADDRSALLAKADRILFGSFIIQLDGSMLLSLKIVRLSDAKIEGTKRIEIQSDRLYIYSQRIVIMEQKIAEMLLGSAIPTSNGPSGTTTGSSTSGTTTPASQGDDAPAAPKQPQRVILSMFDYLNDARWGSGKLVDAHNTNPSYSLTYPGTPDAKGHVQIVTGTVLEDNSAPRCLHMHPAWVEQGTIKGHLGYIDVLPDRAFFSAKVGFIKPQGNPGTDGVRFWVWVHYTVNGQAKWEPIVNELKPFNGMLKTVYADLSRFSGQRIRLEFRVDAGASSAQDWAVWVDPQIEGYR